jgi:hypothetical protein
MFIISCSKENTASLYKSPLGKSQASTVGWSAYLYSKVASFLQLTKVINVVIAKSLKNVVFIISKI